jgi:hypothetical protein
LEPIWQALAGIAGLWVLAALFAAARALNFLHRSEPVPGFIVAAESYTDDSYCPVVEFLHQGAVYRTKGRFGTNLRSIRVGQPVVVRLRDGRPDQARIGSLSHLFAVPLVFVLLAAVFGAFAGCVAAVD